MDMFDNCRICLQQINHEPIKMTRIILKFIENSLHMRNITKPNSPTNVKQNLCAACFNKLSDLQDFHELCKDADEFWQNLFENEKKLTIVLDSNTDLINAIDSDYKVTGNNPMEELTPTTTTQQYAEEDDQLEQKSSLPPPTIQDLVEEAEEELAQNDHFDNMDLTDWPDDSQDGINDLQNIENHQHLEMESREETHAIIEYEYQLDNDDADMEHISTMNEGIVESVPLEEEFILNAVCEEIDDDSSNDGTIQESLKDILDDPQNEVGDSSFFLQPIEESGKVKMGYKCQHCDKIFSRVYDIESHYNIHYGVKPYICTVCGKSFRQKNILTTHEAIHFGKKVECKECGKKFARKSQLILHHRMHRDEKPFKCVVEGCNAAFRQRQHLIDHSYIHSGEKNFNCNSCPKSFHTRKRLQDHIYKVHSQNRYRCDICEKAFLKPHMLKNHMISAHKVEMDDVSHLKTTLGEKKPTKKVK